MKPNRAATAILAICLATATGCGPIVAARQQKAAVAAAVQAEKAALNAALNAASAKGSADATQDIGNGMLKQKEYPPLPAPAWHPKYVTLLKERCNVEWEVVQGPPGVSETLRAEVAAYNEVMRVEIERRCGAGIFQKLRDEAEGKAP
jgi:hypothetical protein